MLKFKSQAEVARAQRVAARALGPKAEAFEFGIAEDQMQQNLSKEAALVRSLAMHS